MGRIWGFIKLLGLIFGDEILRSFGLDIPEATVLFFFIVWFTIVMDYYFIQPYFSKKNTKLNAYIDTLSD